MSITKNVHLNWYSSIKKKIEEDSDDFWHRKLTLKVKFWHFLTPSHYTNSQNLIIFFGYVDSIAKIFPISYPPLENSTIRITITARFICFDFISMQARRKQATSISLDKFIHSFKLVLWVNVKGVIHKLNSMQGNKYKVHIFWEGHKILRNLHLTFVLRSASQK